MLFRLLFVFFLSSPYVLAENVELNAQQWLTKMSHAMKTLNYHGTVAFFSNNRLDTMKYSHSSEQGQEQEKLLSLNSPMREVIREEGSVRCVFKDSKKVVVNHSPVSQSFLVDLPADLSIASAVYDFSLQGEESIAMQPTRVIAITAKDNYRYGRKIWIHKLYFLPLKVQVYDLSGKTFEQVVFTDIQVDQNAVAHVEDKLKNSPAKVNSAPFTTADFVLEAIPLGFQTVFFMPMDSNESVDHLLLSDGFSSISVYREKKMDDAKNGLQTLGAVNSYTQLYENNQITAMGEVPAKTVQLIAQGVKFR